MWFFPIPNVLMKFIDSANIEGGVGRERETKGGRRERRKEEGVRTWGIREGKHFTHLIRRA